MTVNTPLDPLGDSGRLNPLRPRGVAPDVGAFGTSQSTLRRVSGLIELGTMVVIGLIGLRFILKLMAANPGNPFAALIYFVTTPFLAIFFGLTPTPSFSGIEIEFFDLVAVVFYFVLSWAVVRLLWILFARLRSS
jgi:hypothetical protein